MSRKHDRFDFYFMLVGAMLAILFACLAILNLTSCGGPNAEIKAGYTTVGGIASGCLAAGKAIEAHEEVAIARIRKDATRENADSKLAELAAMRTKHSDWLGLVYDCRAAASAAHDALGLIEHGMAGEKNYGVLLAEAMALAQKVAAIVAEIQGRH